VEQDTSEREIERYHTLLRAASPEQRLRATVGLSKTVRALAMAGLRDRHPSADEDELRVRLTVRLYGRGVAAKIFGVVPADAV
jgi:hypothetical protein